MPFPKITAEDLTKLERARKEYKDHPDLTGIDLGFKYETVDGREVRLTDRVYLRFMVREKIQPETAIKPLERKLPSEFEGLPTDVIQSRFDLSLHALDLVQSNGHLKGRLERANPMQPGISISHELRGAGTLGLIVYCNQTDKTGVLSCAHVLAPGGAQLGEPIYQPSVVDGGDPRFDAVASLGRSFLDLDGDAAFAILNRLRMVDLQQLGTTTTITSISEAEAELGERLAKSGRGSGWTEAQVDGRGYYRLNLKPNEYVEMAGFRLVPMGSGPTNGSRRREISLPGDSGAVWYRPGTGGHGEGVGLHVDGEDPGETPEFAIACHLNRVMEKLNVSLVPVDALPTSMTGFVRRRSADSRPRGLPKELDDWMQQNADKLRQVCGWFEEQKGKRIRATSP